MFFIGWLNALTCIVVVDGCDWLRLILETVTGICAICNMTKRVKHPNPLTTAPICGGTQWTGWWKRLKSFSDHPSAIFNVMYLRSMHIVSMGEPQAHHHTEDSEYMFISTIFEECRSSILELLPHATAPNVRDTPEVYLAKSHTEFKIKFSKKVDWLKEHLSLMDEELKEQAVPLLSYMIFIFSTVGIDVRVLGMIGTNLVTIQRALWHLLRKARQTSTGSSCTLMEAMDRLNSLVDRIHSMHTSTTVGSKLPGVQEEAPVFPPMELMKKTVDEKLWENPVITQEEKELKPVRGMKTDLEQRVKIDTRLLDEFRTSEKALIAAWAAVEKLQTAYLADKHAYDTLMTQADSDQKSKKLNALVDKTKQTVKDHATALQEWKAATEGHAKISKGFWG